MGRFVVCSLIVVLMSCSQHYEEGGASAAKAAVWFRVSRAKVADRVCPGGFRDDSIGRGL